VSGRAHAEEALLERGVPGTSGDTNGDTSGDMSQHAIHHARRTNISTQERRASEEDYGRRFEVHAWGEWKEVIKWMPTAAPSSVPTTAPTSVPTAAPTSVPTAAFFSNLEHSVRKSDSAVWCWFCSTYRKSTAFAKAGMGCKRCATAYHNCIATHGKGDFSASSTIPTSKHRAKLGRELSGDHEMTFDHLVASIGSKKYPLYAKH